MYTCNVCLFAYYQVIFLAEGECTRDRLLAENLQLNPQQIMRIFWQIFAVDFMSLSPNVHIWAVLTEAYRGKEEGMSFLSSSWARFNC